MTQTNTRRCINIVLYIIFTDVFPCNGVSWLQQLEHIVRTRQESEGGNNLVPSRRLFYNYDPRDVSKVLGVPEYPNHLPEAEPVQPGHTLIKPTFGMLKSAIKFPHRDLEDGSGVYGNIDNLGLSYDGTNERVLYTRFRRMPSDYVMVIPEKNRQPTKPRFKIAPTVLDWGNENTFSNLLAQLKKLKLSGNVNIFVISPLDELSYQALAGKSKSYYLSANKPKESREQLIYRTRPVKPVREYLRNKLSEDPHDFFVSGDDEKAQEDDTEEEKSKASAKQKINSFLNTQDLFNHVILNDDAPDHVEFLPSISKQKLREWWYYNQDDYNPFTDN